MFYVNHILKLKSTHETQINHFTTLYIDWQILFFFSKIADFLCFLKRFLGQRILCKYIIPSRIYIYCMDPYFHILISYLEKSLLSKNDIVLKNGFWRFSSNQMRPWTFFDTTFFWLYFYYHELDLDILILSNHSIFPRGESTPQGESHRG